MAARLWSGATPAPGPDLRETLLGFDLFTGAERWRLDERDYLSDIIYDRYSIGAPVVDPVQRPRHLRAALQRAAPQDRPERTAGVVRGHDVPLRPTHLPQRPHRHARAVRRLGDRATASPPTGAATAPPATASTPSTRPPESWPGSSTPGTQPRDSSFSTPYVHRHNGKATLLAGTGCGHVVAVDARTGTPRWRAKMSEGGVNISVAVHDGIFYATHAKEALDSSKIGGMMAWRIPTEPLPTPADGSVPTLGDPLWTAEASALSSSPIVLPEHGLVAQVTMAGELLAFDLKTGAKRWEVKLGPDQLHASPLYAGGLLYIPLRDGSLHVVQPGPTSAKVLQSVQLEGQAIGTPSVSYDRLMVHTTAKLYVFALPDAPTKARGYISGASVPEGPATTLRVQPSEFLLRPGEHQALTAELLNADGDVLGDAPVDSVTSFIPPTAKVKSRANVGFDPAHGLVAPDDAGTSAGAFTVRAGGLSTTIRGRTVAGVVPGKAITQDFEGFTPDDASGWTWPPLAWIGARFKWQVAAHTAVDGSSSQVLRKTLDRMIFQRSTVFFGHPDEADYTLTADLMTDGNRRARSDMGLVNQRYLFALKGNQRKLEVSSNYERLALSVPFEAQPGVWYRMTTQVVVDPDGTGHLRAKVWDRTQPEPDAWTLDVTHPDAHTQGAPGFYGFSPQNLHAVYLDNLTLTATPEARP